MEDRCDVGIRISSPCVNRREQRNETERERGTAKLSEADHF